MATEPNTSATKNTHPHVYACDNPKCYLRLAIRSEADAPVEHACPYDPLKRKYMTGVMDERGVEYTKPNLGQSLIEKAWDELDAHLDLLMTTTNEAAKHTNTGWCQALAWTIYTWCSHWFPTVEDVTREAVKRRQIRLGEIEFSKTPGYQWNPMPGDHPEYPRVHKEAYSGGKGSPSPAQKVMPKKVKPSITQAEIDTIKQAMEMFKDADEVARILNIDVNVVKSYV